MRRLLLLTHTYYPETSAGARRLTDIAQFLTKEGWQVTVVTEAPHYPQNRLYEGYGKQKIDIRIEEGIEVIRIRPWIVPKHSLVLRTLKETWFSLQLLIWALGPRRWDVVLSSSPYMFLGQTGLILARLKKAKFVWDIRDLTWLYPRAVGKNTFGLDAVLGSIMKWTASRADALTAVTDEILAYFVDARPSRAIVLPNGVSDKWLDRLLNIPEPDIVSGEEIVVGYAGLIGYNQALHTLVQAAAKVPSIRVFIAGDGPERFTLESFVRDHNIRNVEFLGYLSPEGLFEFYSRVQILIAMLRSHPVYAGAEPTKLWEYFATGRPVIYAGAGRVAEMVKIRGLAKVVPPEQPLALVGAIKEIVDNPEVAKKMATQARLFVSRERRRSLLLSRLAELLADLVSPGGVYD